MSNSLWVAVIGFLLMLLLAFLFFGDRNPSGYHIEMQNSTRPQPEPTMTIEPLN